MAVYLWLRGWVAVGVAMCLWGRAAVAVTAWLRSCVAMWLDGVISEHGQQKCNGGGVCRADKKRRMVLRPRIWFDVERAIPNNCAAVYRVVSKHGQQRCNGRGAFAARIKKANGSAATDLDRRRAGNSEQLRGCLSRHFRTRTSEM